MNDEQPFHIYGTSRVRDASALPSEPLRVIVNEGTGESLTESPIRSPGRPVHARFEGLGAEQVAGD